MQTLSDWDLGANITPTTPIMLIGPTERTSQLKTHITPAVNVVELIDPDTDDALAAISARRPSAVIIERDFGTSTRGSALINGIRRNADVGRTEILLGSHDSDRAHLIPLPVEMITPSRHLPCGEKSPGEFCGTRRVTRLVLHMGILLHVNGAPATVVNLSRIGVQILSSPILRPSQQVRVSFATEPTPLRCSATVVWSQYEASDGNGDNYYRAGLEFVDADGDAVDTFCVEHRDPTSVE